MQKAASSQGTSGRAARSGGDALAPPACSSSSPPPLPPPPPPITPPASAASTAGAGPGAGAGAGAPAAAAKRPKSPDPQRASWAQAAANCARLHHIAMWRHRWLGYGWGETATSAARVKKSEKKRRHNDEIMKEVLRHIAKNESIAVKPQRNNLKSVRPSTQHYNRSSTATAPQRLRNAGHARPRNHPPIRGDKLMSAIRRQRIRKNSARPQTQRRSRVEKKSPTTQRQGSSSDAQTGKQTKHESRKERASQSLQQIRCSSNTGSTQRRRRRSRDSFQSQRDNGISSSSQRRHRSSDHSLVMSQPRGRSCDKRSCSQTSGDESLSPDRRETSTSPGRKCASTSVSPQRRCKKETATKQTKKRSDEKSPTVTQPGRRGRDDDPKTMIPTRRKRSDSVERLSQPIRRNHMEITHSAPHLPSSHTTSILKRSRRGISNEASESSERRSRSCTRTLSDSRLQDRSPDRRPSEGWVRDLKTNIVSTFDQPNNYYCNKTLMKYFADATLPGNVEKAQPWEYRNGSRFRSSWWRHRRPYLVSTTTQTTRRSRHNPNGGNMSSRSRRSEVSSGSPHRRVNIAARTSQFRERSHERPSMPEPYSRGVTAQARTSQTQARHYNWTNIPPSPRDHSPAGLESHPRRKRHGNSSSSTKHNTTEESMRQNRRNCVTPSPPHPRLLHHESILAEALHGSNIISRATQTKSQRFGRSSRTHLRCRDAAVMTTQPKLWRLDTGTAMRPPAMKEDASSSASLPSAVDLSLSIFLQILRQPLVAAAAAAAVAAAAGANGPIPPSEPQPSAAVGAGDSATPTPCKPPEE